MRFFLSGRVPLAALMLSGGVSGVGFPLHMLFMLGLSLGPMLRFSSSNVNHMSPNNNNFPGPTHGVFTYQILFLEKQLKEMSFQAFLDRPRE